MKRGLRFWTVGLCLGAALWLPVAEGAPPDRDAVNSALIRCGSIDAGGAPIELLHDYGELCLVRVDGPIPAGLARRMHPVAATDTVGFRGWTGTLTTDRPGPELQLAILGLIGPLDPDWRDALEAAGLEILAPAHPHALVVRGGPDGVRRARRLETSEGFPVVVGFAGLPVEARLHRSLLPALRGDAAAAGLVVRLAGWPGRPLTAATKSATRGGEVARLNVRALATLLVGHPDIGYVEPVFDIELHNNLAARAGALSAEPLWDAGFTGTGVVIGHNDAGVDLDHPELAGAVAAASGRMSYTDTAHGTHTAASIVGRGRTAAPDNTSGCGDQTNGLPAASGMAPGATLVTNNLFDGGSDAVAAMMAWGSEHGAALSNNSWGLVGQGGQETGYSAASAAADAAVRDADPGRPGSQPVAVFFSAGNTGPGPGTVTAPGTAKNVITVGAVQNDRCGAWVPGRQPGPDPAEVVSSSARGPSQNRIKPDVVAPGSDVLSAESGDPYAVQLWDLGWTGPELALNTGTSQACALTTGGAALVYEAMWRLRGRRPSPALLKAVLVAAAAEGGAGLDPDRGWGRVDIEAAAAPLAGGGFVFDQDETAELATGQLWSGPAVVHSASGPLEIALVWTDPPGEEDADHPLVNDLDLMATSPSGTVYRGNVFTGRWSTAEPGAQRDADNTVEIIRVEHPETGNWSVEVVGVAVAEAPAGLDGQDFALACLGDVSPCAEPPVPPAAVAAAPVGDNVIRVSWSAVPGADGYEISRSRTPGGRPYEPVATVTSNVDWYDDTDVSGGSDYFYVVRATRGCWSPYSEETSATAVGVCRLTPDFAGVGSIDDLEGSTCSLRVGWTAAAATCPSAVVYDVYRGGGAPVDPVPANRVAEGVAGSAWVDSGLADGADVAYLVRARHAGQAGDDGNQVSLTGRASGWHDIYLDDGAEGGIDGWRRLPGSAADSGTEPWRVTDDDAWDGDRSWFAGDGDRVRDQALITAEPIELPAGAEPVLTFRHRYRFDRGRDGGRLEISTNGGLEWFDVLDSDGQGVPADSGRWLSAGYTDTFAAPTNPLYLEDGWSGDSRGWLDSRLDLTAFAGRRILLRWRAVGDDTPGVGGGWWVDAIRLVEVHACQSCQGPDPPAAVGAVPSPDGVDVAWQSVAGAADYLVYRAIHDGGPLQLLSTVSAPATGLADGSASGGTRYDYSVAADSGCRSDRSPAVTVTAGGPCTRAPAFWGLDRVIDRREAGCALDLEWRPADPGCDGAVVTYKVYRARQASGATSPPWEPEELVAAGVAGPRYRDLTAVDREVYRYRVTAVDGMSGVEDASPVSRVGSTTGPDEVRFSDSVEAAPDGWWTAVGSSVDSGTEPWRVVTDLAHTGERAWFCADEPHLKDQVVGLSEPFVVDDASTVLSFAHLFDVEPFWDGGRLEFSIDGGASWHDILLGDGHTVAADPGRFLRGGYTGAIGAGTGHPFAGARAWTGFNDGWTTTEVSLADFVGLTVRFRWRLGCDVSEARLGWWLDDVELKTTNACVPVLAAPPRHGGSRVP